MAGHGEAAFCFRIVVPDSNLKRSDVDRDEAMTDSDVFGGGGGGGVAKDRDIRPVSKTTRSGKTLERGGGGFFVIVIVAKSDYIIDQQAAKHKSICDADTFFYLFLDS